MRETIRKAREREEVISALMPFRGSFYEHFGYGFVERRNQWTVPLAVLPAGDFEGIRFYRENDFPEFVRFRQRVAERGQCDLERPEAIARFQLKPQLDEGMVVVDRPRDDGPIRGLMAFERSVVDKKDFVQVWQIFYEDISALKRLLSFLASLRDQFHSCVMMLPADLPLHWLLRERQVPHRTVNHFHAECRQETRMQVRVLDHERLIEAMHLPSSISGKVTVSVRESEGHESRFRIDLSEGRAEAARSTSAPDFSCPDHVWAAVVCGDLPAQRAVELGIASAGDEQAVKVLSAFVEGPTPYSNEYF
jgi:predicted acetyltransferase